MKNYYSILLKSLTAFALLFSLNVTGQTVGITGFSFPGPPATSCTNTMLDVNVTLLCINAVHQGNTVNIVGTTITVDIDYTLGPICLGALSFPVHNVNLGMIPAGTYSVVINGRLNAGTLSTSNTSLVVTNCCTAVPSFVPTNDTVCVGDSVYFGNTSVGATSRQWYVNNSSVSTSLHYGRRYNTPGNYSIKLVVSNGTCSDSITKNVLVSALPTLNLGTDKKYCPNGGSVTLDAGAGRDSIRWSNNATSRTLVVDTPGTFYVTVYKNKCSSTDTISVSAYTVVPVDLGADVELCYGDSLTLNVLLTGSTYLWQNSSTLSSFKVKAAGTYHVRRTDKNGCATFDTINVTYDTCYAGISELALKSMISIFPNPAKDVINITSNADHNTSYSIGIYDLRGKLVKSTNVSIESGVGTSISIDDLKSGMYVVKIGDGQLTHSKTFIKQ